MLQLPIPDTDAQQHSLRLVESIKQDIQTAGGSINFAQYMAAALSKPQLGYYSSGNQKFGAVGDFITAPELSPLFSRCLAQHCASVLRELSQKTAANILEFGAGSGAMAAGILLELERLGLPPTNYFIIEPSAELKQRQRQTLQLNATHLLQHVQWLDRLPDKSFSGIVLANEVLDAMPVHRFYKNGDELGEYYVSWNGQQFTWQPGPFSDEHVAQRVNNIAHSLPNSYISEINLAAEAWIATVADMLQQGVILIIDYGFPQHEYYHAQRDSGTLMCPYRHYAHPEPFLYPGLQDITAHLDFSALAHAADQAGLMVAGFTNQAFFLLGNGLEKMLQAIDVNSPEYLKSAQQVKTLTMPSEMGELFKVMALTRQYNSTLPGFQLQDRRASL